MRNGSKIAERPGPNGTRQRVPSASATTRVGMVRNIGEWFVPRREVDWNHSYGDADDHNALTFS
jgi:hypothetical protein